MNEEVKLEKISGVYKIVNTINRKMYIGSSIHINDRWKEHKRYLKNNKHHSNHLQKSWNKYGKDNFKFEIIERCEENETLIKEQYYLDLYKTYNRNKGYNISTNSSAPMMGRKHSEETKIKLSEIIRNRDASAWIRGEDKPNSKFKDEDIIKIKKLVYEGNKILDIAKLYNVEPNTITQIKTGDRWSHIKTEYDDLILQTPRQKLTKEDVINIKKLLIEENLNIIEISELFEVTFGLISSIKNLNSWENIGEEYNEQLANRLCVKKLDKNKVKEIKYLLLEGKSCFEISKIYNVTRSTISYIKQNKTWKDVFINEDDVLNKVYFEKGAKPGSRIPIIQLSIDGEFIKEWNSSSEASKILNINASAITKCCKGKQLTCKGYKWIYKSEYEK